MNHDPLVLSFDLDDTLWPVGPLMIAAESAMLSWLRERHPDIMRHHDANRCGRCACGSPRNSPSAVTI